MITARGLLAGFYLGAAAVYAAHKTGAIDGAERFLQERRDAQVRRNARIALETNMAYMAELPGVVFQSGPLSDAERGAHDMAPGQ